MGDLVMQKTFSWLKNAGLSSLFIILAGCAYPEGPDSKVSINSGVEPKVQGLLDQDREQGESESEGEGDIDAVVKYGTGKLINRPIKRKFSKKNGEYSLDFVNIAIAEFASVVFTEMLHKNYVLDNAIKGEVTVQTRGQVNSAQLLSIVESVLASKNAVMIARQSHFDLMPISKAKNYSLKPELYSARNIKPGYRMVIVPVNYINPDDLKPILETVAPGVGHLKIDKDSRSVVVTGTEYEIANVVDAIQIFDVSWLETKSIALLPVKNTRASNIKNEISKILTSQNPDHQIVLETFDRFNALLIVAPQKKEVDAVKNWLTTLDVEVPTVDTQLFVYKVQNRKAGELADLLNGIFGDGSSSSVAADASANDKTASSKEIVVTNKKAARAPSSVDNKKSALKIVADDTNNSLVILARKSEYSSIKNVIDDLDVLPLQVLIEVSIVEVTLSDELTHGLEWFLKHNGVGSGKYDTETLLDTNAGAGLGAIVPGFSFLLSGSGSLVQAVFNTLAAESKLNVLSSPSLMALDNHTATIRVGNQQPVQVASARSTDNDVLTQSIEFKSTGVLLSVTPRVNSGGLVTMELSQEVTDVGAIDDATGQRSFLQRNINSTVAVQNGNTIVLGGLITENYVESESGIPGAYDLPIVGGLFGKTSKAKVKRELIVLITPNVISNHENASKITQEYAEKMKLLKSSLITSD